VDADKPAVSIYKRTTRIAGIDGGVGLDEVLVIEAHRRAALGADNSARHGLADTERIADGEHDVTHFDLVAIRQRQERQIARFNLDYSNIRFRIAADDFAGKLAAVIRL